MRKHKQKKIQPINFTPLVDLNMLLIVFFLFCNIMGKPNTIDIALPIADEDLPKSFFEEEEASLRDVFPITLLLGANNKIYRYIGVPQYDDYTYIKEMTYSELRTFLTSRFRESREEIVELKKLRKRGEISKKDYDNAQSRVKRRSDPVVIKPTDYATYKNLIDILDEMTICEIPRFAILDMEDSDHFVLMNYLTKGQLLRDYDNSIK